MKSIVISFLLIFGVLFIEDGVNSALVIEDRSVADVLAQLGEHNQSKYPDYSIPGVSAKAGETLVKEGFAMKEGGGKTKKQSKHFVCTSCHNVVKEDIDLADLDPQSRLEFSVVKKIPFLQGTTLYGAVNRQTYYNDDYEKKYGDLVKDARNDVREAIKLCAVECAQGRDLKTWELESILAYMWTLELKMSDLLFSPSEVKELESVAPSIAARSEKVKLIQSKYASGAPAHFTYPPDDRKEGYEGYKGNPDNGKLIYEQSCLYCHEKQKYSYLHLDNSKLSFKHLNKKAGSYHPHSIYQVTRWGVPVKSGKRAYMPQYPLEKMSNQQLEDLRAYIHQKAN